MTIEADLRAAFTKHMNHACKLYPSLVGKDVKFIIKQNMGKMAGTARIQEISVNLTMARQNYEHIANHTIPHEIAHVICFIMNWDNGHGRMWKRVAASLGIVPDRCFSLVATGIKPVMMRQRSQYLHKATCGTEIWLSDVVHGKIMKGETGRYVKLTGGRLAASTFTGKMK